uniref:Cytochrome b561 domain-containing protein n=1 Tax=Heterorhabditis bacteriophora TaxID=37862 RepID=A0A1I7WAB1_HETBA
MPRLTVIYNNEILFRSLSIFCSFRSQMVVSCNIHSLVCVPNTSIIISCFNHCKHTSSFNHKFQFCQLPYFRVRLIAIEIILHQCTVAVIISLVQPILALMRCAPDTGARPIFNWTHRSLGLIGITFAGCFSFIFKINAFITTYIIIQGFKYFCDFLIFVYIGNHFIEKLNS